MSAVHNFQTRPIDQWPTELTRNRKRAPFRADYASTFSLLARELRHLGASSYVILMAIRPDEIRTDGKPRSSARPDHPGVILCFRAKGKDHRFPCDRFNDWVGNIRAIALALEALRKVDRYGVTKRGEQYTGWQALPAPAANGFGSREEALGFLRRIIGGRVDVLDPAAAIRECEMVTHPDKGGDAEDFKKVQRAKEILLA